MPDQQLSSGMQRALLIACVVLGVPALALTCVRLLPFPMPTPLVQLVSFAPYLVLPLAATQRRRRRRTRLSPSSPWWRPL